MTTQAPQFAGQWEKVTRSACGQKYPETIQFQAAGSFVGRSDPPGTYAHWDVGSFEVVDPAHVRISIANDALVTYEFSIQDDALTFRDPDGCEFSYRRSR